MCIRDSSKTEEVEPLADWEQELLTSAAPEATPVVEAAPAAEAAPAEKDAE
jgi:hypothetical protein